MRPKRSRPPSPAVVPIGTPLPRTWKRRPDAAAPVDAPYADTGRSDAAALLPMKRDVLVRQLEAHGRLLAVLPGGDDDDRRRVVAEKVACLKERVAAIEGEIKAAAAVTAVQTPTVAPATAGSGEAAALRDRLAALRKKAERMGVSLNGRARRPPSVARRFQRGANRVDFRTRTVRCENVGAETGGDGGGHAALAELLGQYGAVAQVRTRGADADVTYVTFVDRAGAEKALAVPVAVVGGRTVTLSWHEDGAPRPSDSPQSARQVPAEAGEADVAGGDAPTDSDAEPPAVSLGGSVGGGSVGGDSPMDRWRDPYGDEGSEGTGD